MDKYIQMLDLIQPMSFTWIDIDDEKIHLSYGAQHVEDAMHQVGLNESDFAGLQKIKTQDGDCSYSLCKEEFVPILHASQKRDRQYLESRINELENEIDKLKSILSDK